MNFSCLPFSPLRKTCQIFIRWSGCRLSLEFGAENDYSSPVIFEHQDYRSFLKATLSDRTASSSRYSLRAFADKLGISTSFMSEVVNSKKNLSVELAFKIAIKLELTDLETQYLCLLVQLEQEKDPLYREQLIQRLNDLNPTRKGQDLTVDLFKSISEWYHSAILELTYLQGLKLNAASAARKLGINKSDAEIAIERLIRLNLLERDENGRLQKVHSFVYSETQIPNSAFKSFHSQILALAAAAVQKQTPSERISATDIMAIDSKYLGQVDRLSREFSAAVLKLADKSKVKNHVYALAVHCFRLSRKEDR
jgi:uncharacterized protein (TIGR02147 family)